MSKQRPIHRDAFVLTLQTLITGWNVRMSRSSNDDEIEELNSLVLKADAFLRDEFGA